MSHSALDTYLDTQVRTATPQKLRLMLIEGAIRFGRQALECWSDEQRRAQRLTALARCNDIVTELFGAIREDSVPVAGQVKAIYQFLLVQIAKITGQNDPQMLREVVEILEQERETWRQVCEQMPEAPERPGGVDTSAEDVTTAGMQAITPQAQPTYPQSDLNTSQLSLEA